jgi:ribosomal protein S18 acetylase RimI-like enzyme
MIETNAHNKFIIRNATLDDAADVAAISVQAWQESYQGIIDQAVLENLSVENRTLFRQKILQEQPYGHFVACIGNKIIGFCDAGTSRFEMAKGEIYAIYVLNAHKGLGVGFQLFCASKSYFQSQHLCPFLIMALSQNKSARSFYERQGGQICGENVYTVEGKSYPEVCYRFDCESV